MEAVESLTWLHAISPSVTFEVLAVLQKCNCQNIILLTAFHTTDSIITARH